MCGGYLAEIEIFAIFNRTNSQLGARLPLYYVFHSLAFFPVALSIIFEASYLKLINMRYLLN